MVEPLDVKGQGGNGLGGQRLPEVLGHGAGDGDRNGGAGTKPGGDGNGGSDMNGKGLAAGSGQTIEGGLCDAPEGIVFGQIVQPGARGAPPPPGEGDPVG